MAYSGQHAIVARMKGWSKFEAGAGVESRKIARERTIVCATD